MTYLPGPNLTLRGSRNLHFMGPKNVLLHLTGDYMNWEKLPIMCLSVWFHLFAFFSKNNGFRAKICGTVKKDLFSHYNFCGKYFFPRWIFIDIKLKYSLKIFFSFVFKNQIFIIIFVISASKYVGIVSFKLLRGKGFSEVYPIGRLHVIDGLENPL